MPEIAQCSRCSEHRGKRRLQVMGDRGEKRRAQPLCFGGALHAIHLLDQLDAFDRERSLIPQGIEEPPLIGREQGAGFVAVDPHHADGAAPGAHRQE